MHHITGKLEYGFGKAPVFVFFCLSGFWVHRVWQQRYIHTRAPWLTFITSRWWRLAPVLILASALGIAAHAVARDAKWLIIRDSLPELMLAAMRVIGCLRSPLPYASGPAWSLDIEMQFYLIAPLLSLLAQRNSPLVVAGLCLLVSEIFASFSGLTLPCFLWLFITGMLAAEHDWRPSPRIADIGLALSVLLVLGLWLMPGHGVLSKDIGGGVYGSVLFNMGLALLAIPFALTTVYRPSDMLDHACADHSYLIYLLHWPAMILLYYLPWGEIPYPLVVLGLNDGKRGAVPAGVAHP